MVTNVDSYDLLIQKLDRFIRKFYLNQLIRGVLYSLALILGLFLFFSLLENFFFFDTTVRKVIFYGFTGTSIAALGYLVLLPLSKYFSLGKRISHEQASVIIGNHFTDVKDQLLNILQLKRQTESTTSRELILASIQQKTEKIQLVPFRSAIDLGKNRKYLRYALPPALILLAIFFASPTMITDPTHRIINNNTEFEKAAPFSFEIMNRELEAVQSSDYIIQVSTEGKVEPAEVFIDIDNFQYRMRKSEDGFFTYTFKNLQKPQSFELFSGRVRSKSYKLNVLAKPNLTNFEVRLDYPSYTGRKDETLSNIGDLVVPAGTKLNWIFDTEHTDAVQISFSDKGIKEETEKRTQDSYRFEKTISRDVLYKIYYSNMLIAKPDSVNYSINAIADEYPEINVESFRDSLNKNVVYLIGGATDDYGLLALNFNYSISKADGSTISDKELVVNPRSRETSYSYNLDISEFNLEPGDKLSYYFEVFDNDAVNGSKSSKTGLMEFEKPSIEAFEEKENQNEEDIEDKLRESLKESRKIKESLRELRDKMLQKREPDWEDKKALEKLMERQKQLEQKLQEAKDKFDENLENQEEFTQRNEEIKEKQQKLQELFEEALDNETQELMQKIEELMQELDKESMIEELQNMEMNEDAMEKNTERLLELFKNLEVEKEVKDMVEKLREMSEKQEELSEKSKEENSDGQQLEEEQEKLNEEFEDLQEKMEEIEKKNEALQRPKDLGDDNEGKMDDIKQDMQDSKQSLEKQQNNKASQQQKNASDKMQQMADGMESAMASMQMEQMEEDIAALRQLLENLVTLSFDQEDLIDDLQNTRINTPRYVSKIQEQFKLKDDFEMIQDSLQELAKRVDQIQSFVLDKVVEIDSDMNQSIDQLEERLKPEAEANQRRTMKNVNDLALMLSESMQQMQQQMSSMMMGSQMCNKPGGIGGKPGDIPMDKITEGQKELNKELKSKQEGGQGKDGMSSRDFAEAAARQAALRKALEELQQQKMEQGKGDKGIQELIDAMDKVETDLVNKRLDSQLLMRQQEILTRLLEAEKADKMRELDNLRKAESGKEYKKELPPALKEYLRKREAELDMYNKVSPALRPYYKSLVDEYYKTLKNS